MFARHWAYPSAELVWCWVSLDPHNGMPEKYRKMRHDWWKASSLWLANTAATDTDG